MKKSMLLFIGLAALFSLLWSACDPTGPQDEPQEEPPIATATATPTPTSPPPQPGDGEEVSLENWSPWYMPPLMIQMFGPPVCSATPPEGLGFPSVLGQTARGTYASLCLYGLDLGATFRVRLTSPDNNQMAEGIFATRQDGGEWVLEQVAPEVAAAETVGSILGEGPSNRIQIPFYLPAGVSPGEWRLEVEAGGRMLEGSMVLGEERFPSISIIPIGEINLFQHTYGAAYTPEDQIWLLMSNFGPRQTQVVDVYYTPKTLEIDASLGTIRAKRVKSFEVSLDENGFYGVQNPADLAGVGTYIFQVRLGDDQGETPAISCMLPWITCYQVQTRVIRGDAPACQGTAFGGFCWYQGEESASCEAVCDPHGGVHQATLTYAGSQGSPQNCREALNQMGLPLGNFYETTQGGIGCFTILAANGNTIGYWDKQVTTAGATYPGRQRICACQE